MRSSATLRRRVRPTARTETGVSRTRLGARATPAALLRQQESLRRFIEAISSELELRSLFTLIVRQACDLLGAQNGAIGLFDEQHNLVRIEAAYNMPEDALGVEHPPGAGLFGQVLLTRATAILNRYSEIPQPTPPGLLDNAVIGAPLVWRGQMIGVLGLGPPQQPGARPKASRFRAQRFTSEDAELLTLLARHAVIAIVNARLFARQKERTERNASITEIGRQINHSLELSLVLQTAVEAISKHLKGANVTLLLVDPEDSSRFVLGAKSDNHASTIPVAYSYSSIPDPLLAADQGDSPAPFIPGHLSTASVEQPDDKERGRERNSASPTSSAGSELAIPLIVDNRMIGVLNIASRQPLAEESLSDLSIIASQVSSAINNARHYEEEKKRRERLELIARVGQRITARLNQDELFTTTIDELHSQLGYDHVTLFLVEPAGGGPSGAESAGWLVQRASAGTLRTRWPRGAAVGYRQPIQEGIPGLAARQRTPVLVNDLAAETHLGMVAAQRLYQSAGDSNGRRADEIRAELAAPILSGERLLGVLDVAGRTQFLDEDVKAVQIIAGQLAVAIEHAYLFSDTQRALNETALLYQTSQRISVALDVNEVVETYLSQVAARGRYACSVALYEFDAAGERVAVVVQGRWTPAEGLQCPMLERLPYTQDALDATLDSGQTVTISNVYTDPRVSQELRRIQEQDSRPALAMIPLLVRGRRIGLVILSYPAAYEWLPVHLHPYQITAAQLATAIDNRLQQALLAKHDQQLAVLEERRRLARELHDSVTQLLFSITLIAQSLGSAWRRNAAEGEQRIQRLLELSQAALAEMRALLVELRPPEQMHSLDTAPLTSLAQVQRHGLAAALRAHVTDLARDGLLIDLDTTDYNALASEQEESLFRLAQESLNNVLKHAKAARVQVRLAVQEGAVYLSVRDDGVGFRHPAPDADGSSPRAGGMGLRTMRERAAALGGSLRIQTAPGKGTAVEVVIPDSSLVTTKPEGKTRS